MSYRTYQPGLARRLKYSAELYERQRSGMSQFTARPFIAVVNGVQCVQKKGLLSEKLLQKSNVAVVLEEFNEGLCPICIESFVVYDIYRKLSCNHTFHVKCIDTWFICNSLCPFCRHSM